MQVVYNVAKTLMPRAFRRSIKKRFDNPVAAAFLNLLNEIRITLTARIAARRFRALRGKTGLKVHLGSGSDIRAGWINIDLVLGGMSPTPEGGAGQQPSFINHDLRRGLPLDEGTCEFIYSSHFFEHLECADGARLMRDCYRALRPGGVFRVALPDFVGLFRAYLEKDYEYFDLVDISQVLPDVEEGTESIVDHVNYGVYQYGEHKCIYDDEKLSRVLTKIGFKSVTASSYREGIDPDTPLRRRYSFYVEAAK